VSDYDVAIVGAGPVGLTLALELAKTWGDSAGRIILIDAKSLQTAQQDARILALADTSRQRLLSYQFPDTAVPLHNIHVSEYGRFGRVWMSAAEFGRSSLGWTVPYRDLLTTLDQAVRRTKVEFLREVSVQQIIQTASEVQLLLSDGSKRSAAMLAQAEGGLFGSALQRDMVRDYGQSALVGRVAVQKTTALSQKNMNVGLTAFERFTPDGPLAFLPTASDGLQYTMVWCGATAVTHTRKQADPKQLISNINALMSGRLHITQLEQLHTFALGLNVRRSVVDDRCVAVGNAAQILHPVAGQGLNLGLRDAHTLANSLSPGMFKNMADLDEILQNYAFARQSDRNVLIHLTDAMARGFANRNPLIALGRQAALLSLEFLPGARRFFTESLLFGWVE
jgi:2-octaprenyl-6-methoxyphenol hydroxylase